MLRQVLWVGILLAAGCGNPDVHENADPAVQVGSEAEQQPVDQTVTRLSSAELVPRKDFFDNPTRSQARISPDGSKLSWLAPVNGVMNIWVAPLENLQAAKAITQQTQRGIPVHYWSYDSQYVLFVQDSGGDENYHVYVASVQDASVRDLTPVPDGARATVLGLSKDRPGWVAVGLNDRNPQLFDVYEIEIATGKRTLLAENPGYLAWMLDNQLKPRLAWAQQPSGERNLLSLDGDEPRVIAQFSAQDVMTSAIFGFNAGNTLAYAVDSRGRNTAALVTLDPVNGSTEVIAENTLADISNVIIDPVSREIRAYATEFTRLEWQGLDAEAKQLLQDIRSEITGDLNFTATSADANLMVIAADSPTKPMVYHLFDRRSGQARELFVTRPNLQNVSLQPMQALTLKARDGLTLVSYLTLPAGSVAESGEKPKQPVPMVLYVHGGPWARDSYGYNTIHQWLADRGYAVLSVNYRGSTGFGKNFLNAAKREFAGRMHDDLIDAVNWAINEQIVDAKKIAIMGGSYGGYATLVGLTFTPDVFACGVDIVGPSNLVTLINSFPDYWRPSLAGNWFLFVGDPEKEADRADMYNRSPIARVADIQAPLLIGQGENDPRVTKAESDQIAAAMLEKALPVTYLNYPDEGHGFARPENRMSFYATTEAFLSRCLGGRYEAIGDAFNNSSVQVLHGADYVPGLAEQIR